ncbi:MAG TPA: DUF4255 domain-containing protein [Chloroflexota bacterium]|nr:DUF4255 domain-containing protein [Chloroflexota bacterium]
MSSANAIAAVTFVLRHLLDDQLIRQSLSASVGEVTVSALPPDRIAAGPDERSRLNLFLYRITPHAALRGARNGAAKGRMLALDLHYLLTAYGEQDFQAEILLGNAVQLLLETPVLTRRSIEQTLASAGENGRKATLPPTLATLTATALPEQMERLEITPEFLSTEETSRLWSALQARYRTSAAYKVSSVLMETAG